MYRNIANLHTAPTIYHFITQPLYTQIFSDHETTTILRGMYEIHYTTIDQCEQHKKLQSNDSDSTSLYMSWMGRYIKYDLSIMILSRKL